MPGLYLPSTFRLVTVAATAVIITATASTAGGLSAASPLRATTPAAPCSGDYAAGPLVSKRTLRFGIDPELAGSAGGRQNVAKPVNDAKTLAALRALRPARRMLVLRINRLIESDGDAGIRRFERIIARYTHASFDTELQVRYHPSPRSAGDIAAWTRYVRRVVDAFGSDRRVIAMTITNEVNVAFSPNTSDGAYPGAEAALIRGIVAAHNEAQRRGFRRLRFGFTFAYRFDARVDGAMFTALRGGGRAFRQALGFVGVDYYPELSPGRGIAIRPATLQMMGTMRRCFMRLAALGPSVPIWITESGYDTTPGVTTAQQQRATLVQIVDTVASAARTFNVTDYRWFNLRDNASASRAFAETSGLLTDSYRAKPAFSAYRQLIRRLGARALP